MDATQITDCETMRTWAIQHESKVMPAIEQHTNAAKETGEDVKTLRKELAQVDQKIQRWIGATVVLAPLGVGVVNWLTRKF